jgi:16S rRNA (adenine1518-N6/adenine1519-N6)-dimethyltransferase
MFYHLIPNPNQSQVFYPQTMNLNSEKTIRELLKKYHLRPSKKMGQNFLVNEDILDKIIQNSQLTKNDVVLEIGPGIGALTQKLLKIVKKVVAVEKDKQLAKLLKMSLAEFKNLEIIEGDIMIVNDLPIIKPYKIVANLPYNISLPIIRKFIEGKNPPQEMILMLQKEVAQKICSQKSSIPKIAIELYAKSKILFFVPKESFWPMPKVDGAVIRITDIQKNVPNINEDLFFKILKAGFAHPRKTILNNLSQQFGIEREKTQEKLLKCEIIPKKRGAEIDMDGWIRLSNSFFK